MSCLTGQVHREGTVGLECKEPDGTAINEAVHNDCE